MLEYLHLSGYSGFPRRSTMAEEITYKDAMEAIQVVKGNKKYDDEYFYRVLDVKPAGDSTKVDYKDILTLIQAANGKIDLWYY